MSVLIYIRSKFALASTQSPEFGIVVISLFNSNNYNGSDTSPVSVKLNEAVLID